MGQVTDISQSAINSQGGGGGVTSRLVASLSNVNLKTVAQNVLNWVSGKSAANTTNPYFVFKHVSGTYVNNVISGVAGTGTISIDSDAVNVSGGISGLNLNVGALQVSFVNLNGSETKPKAQVISELIANAQYGFIITNQSGDIIHIEEPVWSEGSYEGQLINVSSPPPVSLTTSAATTITGGVPASETLFNIELDGATMAPLTSMTTTQTIAATSATARSGLTPIVDGLFVPLYPTTGDWVLDVVRGAQDDFVIDVLVYADTIE